MKSYLYCICTLLGCLFAAPVMSATLPGIPEFIDEMVARHQFDREELKAVFETVDYRPQVIEAISRPSTIKPWLAYRAAFVNARRVKLGLLFWDKHRAALRRAEKQYGVPQEIIVALIGVETIYGQQMGKFRTLDALTTLAFDYPRRAAFFRDELENYLLLAKEQRFDLFEVKSSYAGALGIPQFMPGSYRKYAVDFNGNHKIDLLDEPVDAIGSVANYLKEYGWVKGGPVAVHAQVSEGCCSEITKIPRSLADWQESDVVVSGHLSPQESARLMDYTVTEGKEYWLGFNNFEVITRYNNSDFYAMTVYQLACGLKSARQVN